ncbi:transposase [Patescibacteria group bacterium]|nr:transposase [Patescibacteria group bacterium]
MARLIFSTGEYYHIYNRGVEKRDIFLEKGDYLRFIHYLYVLNDDNPLTVDFRRKNFKTQEVNNMYEVRPRTFFSRELLVDILAFCLMPNHFHLFVRQRKEKGISKFMQKLGTAESMFFNSKYDHSGSVFQGKFKAKRVKDEKQALVLANYIHLNAIGLIESNWKRGVVGSAQRVIEFLENYRWSSYLDYIGKKNFPSLIDFRFLRGLIGDASDFRKMINGIIFDQQNLTQFLENLSNNNMYEVRPRTFAPKTS